MAALLQDAGAAGALMAAALLLAGPALWIAPAAGIALVGVAAMAGALSGHVAPIGLAVLGVFAAGCWLSARTAEFDGRGWVLWAALVAATALLFLHLVTGLEGLRVIGPVEIGSGATYEKWVSLDKAGAGVLLLGLALPGLMSRAGWAALLRKAAPVAAATVVAVLGLAAATSAISWDVTVGGFMLWAAFNLATVCLPEEALFRGLVQGRLTGAAAARGWSAHPAIWASAVVFGLAHAPGGAALVAASGLAGLGYGYAFWLTGRIEAAILAHFALNAAHYLFFTYPYPAG